MIRLAGELLGDRRDNLKILGSAQVLAGGKKNPENQGNNKNEEKQVVH